MMDRKKMIFRIITVLVAVIVIIFAVFIMIRQWGLVEGYDFGGGAYYYIDIPGFQQHLPKDNIFTSQIPVWVHVALFFAWGWLMWRLWLWLDKRSEGEEDDE